MSASVDFGLQGSCGINPLWWLNYVVIYTSTHTCVGFSGGSVVKNLPASAGGAGHAGLIPGSGRSPGGGNGNPLWYFCVGNPMDSGACHKESDMATEHVCTQICIYTMHSLKKFYFTFGSAGSSSLHVGFLCLWWVDATLVKVHGFLTVAASLEHSSRALGLSICSRA